MEKCLKVFFGYNGYRKTGYQGTQVPGQFTWIVRFEVPEYHGTHARVPWVQGTLGTHRHGFF